MSGSLIPREHRLCGGRGQGAGAEGDISVEERERERESDGDGETFMRSCAICALGIFFRSSNEGDNIGGQWYI